ncbi:hypothetical protein EIC82_03405 [Enterobacter sp. A11]|nr:hypothetical protein EIC82_03405 [Enterobacter sp. A11]
MLAIILFCNVSLRQRKVSIFKPSPRHNRYLLRIVSVKYPATKKQTPFLLRLLHPQAIAQISTIFLAIQMSFLHHKKKQVV